MTLGIAGHIGHGDCRPPTRPGPSLHPITLHTVTGSQRPTQSDRPTPPDTKQPTHSDQPTANHSDQPTANNPQRPTQSDQPTATNPQRPNHGDRSTATDPQRPAYNDQSTVTERSVWPRARIWQWDCSSAADAQPAQSRKRERIQGGRQSRARTSNFRESGGLSRVEEEEKTERMSEPDSRILIIKNDGWFYVIWEKADYKKNNIRLWWKRNHYWIWFSLSSYHLHSPPQPLPSVHCLCLQAIITSPSGLPTSRCILFFFCFCLKNHNAMAPRGTQTHAPADPNNIAGLTPGQNQQIFEIYRQKAVDERAAAAREHTLKFECIQRESDARIAATTAAAATAPAPAPAPAAPRTIGGDDDILGEVPQEVQNLTLRFAGLPQEEIVKIFHNRYQPLSSSSLARSSLRVITRSRTHWNWRWYVVVKENLQNIQEFWEIFLPSLVRELSQLYNNNDLIVHCKYCRARLCSSYLLRQHLAAFSSLRMAKDHPSSCYRSSHAYYLSTILWSHHLNNPSQI